MPGFSDKTKTAGQIISGPYLRDGGKTQSLSVMDKNLRFLLEMLLPATADTYSFKELHVHLYRLNHSFLLAPLFQEGRRRRERKSTKKLLNETAVSGYDRITVGRIEGKT